MTRNDAGGGDPADRRPRAVAGLPAPGAARGRGPPGARAVVIDAVGPVDCRHARRRGRRLRRPARRRAGRRRPRAVRPRAGDRRHALCSTASRSPRRSPREAMRCGINLVCADRVGRIGHARPVGPREPVPQPGRRRAAACFPYLGAGPRDARAAIGLGQRVGLRPNDPTLPIELCRAATSRRSWSAAGCISPRKVYVFEDPTAGVDVGAKAEIYRLFDVALQAGAAILIVSTDFEEVAKVCHRALVFDRGRVVAELAADDLSVENLLAAASASIGIRQKRPPLSSSTRPGRSCSPLSPTRSSRRGRNLRRCTRWQAIVPHAADLRPADPDGPADRLLLVAAARHLPDRAQRALDPQRQGDHRAAVARGDGADDGRPHRPDGRLRHRDVAHPGDQPAGQVRRALAAGHPDRDRLRRRSSA